MKYKCIANVYDDSGWVLFKIDSIYWIDKRIGSHHGLDDYGYIKRFTSEQMALYFEVVH